MESEKRNIGDTVLEGKYRLGRLIGAGGMGQVFEAVHMGIGHKVAIKYLHKKYVDDAQVIQRFQQEARLAGSIGHDNICEVTDMGTDETGSPYLVMPLLNGLPFDEILKQNPRLQLARVLDIVCQTLSALDAAHKNHIVHRDLKPNNIFITQVGDRTDFVKLLDFGISKVLNQEFVSTLTQSGVALGTPYYMAPEQAQGVKELDCRVDIYAAGVILYEALTNKRPFEGDSYNEVMFKIVSEQFPSPTSLNPYIPEAVEAVIVKSMARHREDRFSGAQEMRLALETCPTELLSTDEFTRYSTASTDCRTAAPFTPASASKAKSAVGDQKRSASGNGRLPLVAALVAVILAVVVAVFLRPWREAEPPSNPVEPKTPSRELLERDMVPSTQDNPNAFVEASAQIEGAVAAPEPAEAKADRVSHENDPMPLENQLADEGARQKRKKRKADQEQLDKENDNTVEGRLDTKIITEF